MLDKYESDYLYNINRFIEKIYNEQQEIKKLLKELIKEIKNEQRTIHKENEMWQTKN